jgi:hypothetical protein
VPGKVKCGAARNSCRDGDQRPRKPRRETLEEQNDYDHRRGDAERRQVRLVYLPEHLEQLFGWLVAVHR